MKGDDKKKEKERKHRNTSIRAVRDKIKHS
jgi:hypothetical protein